MRIKGKFKCRVAIVVDEVFLSDLDTMLNEYFTENRYSAELVNGDEIEFESFDEVLEFDNFSYRSINTLIVRSGIGNYIRIGPSNLGLNESKSSLEMWFEVDDNDKSEEIKRKIGLICDKHRQSTIYTAASKVTSLFWTCLSAFITAFLFVYFKDRNINSADLTNAVPVVWGLTLAMLCMMLSVFCSHLSAKWYPAVIVYLGENIKKIDSVSKLKNNLFWGVLVASTITVVFSIILK